MSASERIQLTPDLLANSIGETWSDEEVDAALQLLANSDGKFPSSVRRLPPELVRAIQRERLVAGMIRAVSDLGYRCTNVQDVLERAGVSRPTFYEHFENKDDCFLAAFDSAAARLRARLCEAVSECEPDWREKVRLGLAALLRFAAEEGEAARLLIVEARAANPEGAERRDLLLGELGQWISSAVGKGRANRPGIATDGVVGGVEALLYSRLSSGETGGLETLLPALVYFAVLPFADLDAGAEELALALP